MVPASSHRIPRVPWYSGYSYLFSHFAYGIVTLFDHFSNMFGYAIVNVRSPLPRCISLYSGLGSSPFARHYSENHLLIFSSSGYLDVSVPRVPLAKLCIHLTIPALRQVSSLIRISADRGSCAAPRSFSQAHVQLPAAFRSLSRPSSAPSAKASTLRPL